MTLEKKWIGDTMHSFAQSSRATDEMPIQQFEALTSLLDLNQCILYLLLWCEPIDMENYCRKQVPRHLSWVITAATSMMHDAIIECLKPFLGWNEKPTCRRRPIGVRNWPLLARDRWIRCKAWKGSLHCNSQQCHEDNNRNNYHDDIISKNWLGSRSTTKYCTLDKWNRPSEKSSQSLRMKICRWRHTGLNRRNLQMYI